jgi:hypothetical protein
VQCTVVPKPVGVFPILNYGSFVGSHLEWLLNGLLRRGVIKVCPYAIARFGTRATNSGAVSPSGEEKSREIAQVTDVRSWQREH